MLVGWMSVSEWMDGYICVLFLSDLMVCTGCCGTLDYIVTYLFKMLSKKMKKAAQGVEEQSPCLGILESHPEMLRQVSPTLARDRWDCEHVTFGT